MGVAITDVYFSFSKLLGVSRVCVNTVFSRSLARARVHERLTRKGISVE